jgi:patatin-like phospholipase/acyl hydrolase
LNSPASKIQTERSERFRILSLDGGGIKGTFAAGFLAALEENTGQSLVDHFDLIAGTSTGGIIALGLGLGIPARDILNFYIDRGPRIFPSTSWVTRFWRRVRHLLAAKHSADQLRTELMDVFGSRRIGESHTRLVIVSYDGVGGNVHLFKTAHSERFTRDYKLTAVEAALATSAAPTYLPVFVGSHGVKFIDGGVWANCPATVAILEAIAVLQRAPGEIDVLSVGTTEEPPRHIPRWRKVTGVIGWVSTIHRLLMEAQVKGSVAQANLLTEHRMIRVNHVVPPGRFRLDDSRSIEELAALGAQQARHHEPKVKEMFLHTPAPQFKPYHRLDLAGEPAPFSPVRASG